MVEEMVDSIFPSWESTTGFQKWHSVERQISRKFPQLERLSCLPTGLNPLTISSEAAASDYASL